MSEAKRALEAEHTEEAIRARIGGDESDHEVYLKDFIYGAIDGTVTTFAVVSGVAGAGLGPGIVLVLGIANLVADGFSMGISNYLGSKAERQVVARTRKSEAHHIKHIPDGEKAEIREIFRRKGFEGADLDRAVEIITSDAERWIDTMIQDEHGLQLEATSPAKAGFVTFVSFVLVGAVPLVVFVIEAIRPGMFGEHVAFVWSSVMTAIAFFLVGMGKARVVHEAWWKGGLETLGVGGVAAVSAYAIGAALKGFVGTG